MNLIRKEGDICHQTTEFLAELVIWRTAPKHGAPYSELDVSENVKTGQ